MRVGNGTYASGLGGEFFKAIDVTLEFIARFPQAGTPVPDISPE